MSDEGTSIMIVQAFDELKSGHYYNLYVILKTLCRTSQDFDGIDRLNLIRKEMPIDLPKFEKWYYKAVNSAPKKKIIFSDIGPVTCEELQPLFEKYAMEPLTIEMAEIIGKVAKNRGLLLQNMIKSKSSVLTSMIEKNQPKVILDA